MGCSCSTAQANAQENARELAKEIGELRDDEQLDMRAVVMLMWKARDNPKLAEIITQLVQTHADEKSVFDGIEFYLPQLVHMILHLEIQWKSNFLEQFALLISQQSLHLALQMYWILVAAMQDYQPEDDEGKRNKAANVDLFIRCTVLQHNLEKSVVFGSPHCRDLEAQFNQGKITKDQLQDMEIKDRLEEAKQIVQEGKGRRAVLEGDLFYKRWNRTSKFSTKGWSKKRFVIQNRILICFEGKRVVRVLPLAHTEPVIVPNEKYQFYFEVREQKRERVWKLRASSNEEMNKWMEVLKSEAYAPPPVIQPGQLLNDTQIARYGFYRSERDFVRDLTDICEDLRFVTVPERKAGLKEHSEKLEIPGCVYLPMRKSTDPWYRVLRILPEKGHPFSTRARCPCLMTFEVVGDGDVDLANYLYQTLDHSTSAQSQGRQEFIKSARKSAVINNAVLESAMAADDPRNMVVSFSDADVNENPAEFSLWAEELKPSATAKHATMLSGTRKQLHFDLGNQALNLVKSAAGVLGEASAQKLENEGVNSVGAVIAQVTEEDKRTASTRIKSMAMHANPNTPVLERIIAKSNDDLRQEVFTMQLMQFHKDVWEEAGLSLYLRTYRILSTSKSTGLLEVITNADSFDGVKKKLFEKNPKARLIDKFREIFPDPAEFKLAQRRYMESLAGSSLVSYIIETRDRHNGNIMLEMDSGRLAHIDFGFIFGMRPGKDKVPYTDFSFERVGFKLTSEMVEIIDGKHSDLWKEYIKLMTEGFLAIRKKAEILITLVEITGYKSTFPCFLQPGGGPARVIRELKRRLMLDLPDSQIPKKIEALVNTCYQARGTIWYEKFQLSSNGIAPVF